MENATTIILPVGDFTAAIVRKVADVLASAAERGRTIVISLQWTSRWSWDALCALADTLRGRHRDARVCFTALPPARRALLREVGLDSRPVVAVPFPASAERVLVAA